MGVMPCGRADCTEILCHRLILDGDDQTYICDDCYKELLNYKAQWPSMTIGRVRTRIVMFMQTPPGMYIDAQPADVDAEFKRLTRSPNDDD